MNTLKASILVGMSLALMTGCGHKKEEPVALPPEQILSGNAILAPQSVTLETHNVPASAAVNAAVPAPTEPAAMELSGPAKDKPANKDIQQALKNAGLYNGPIDGNIGPKTKKAIRDFQSKNGLHPDGKVGPRTWKKMTTFLQSAPAEPTEPSTGTN